MKSLSNLNELQNNLNKLVLKLKTLKLIFLLLLLSLSLIADAKYKFYKCIKQENVYACSSGCAKDPGSSHNEAYLDFKVNVPNNAVITHIYSHNKYSHAWKYTECRVVDKKNWSCIFVPSKLGNIMHEMTNGIFYQYTKGSENYTDQYSLPFCSVDTIF